MKRSIAIFVIALYGILSIGVHIHLHYCCGKLAGMELVSKQSGCCSSEETEGCTLSHNCCSYTQLDFALEDDHYSSSFHFLIPFSKEEILISAQPIAAIEQEINTTNPLDLAVKRRLFLEHSCLIYYA